MSNPPYQRPRGTRDILPADWPLWRQVMNIFAACARAAGYERISTPVLEQANVFERGVGEGTEIISKEMYTLTDRSGNLLALRPEATAGVVRAYIENGLSSLPKPVKLYLIEPMFRYDRPQAGRQRQFYHAGVEVFGSSLPIIDAQVIALAARFYNQLGVSYSLQINSLGSDQTRSKYAAELVKYFSKQAELTELAREQLATNPLRILDSKEPAMVKLVENAPQIIDYLDRGSARHFEQVLELLDQFGVGYDLNPHLVRGLDYYTGTVFEFWGSHEGMQNAIGGGGRYDNLVAQLGGKATPAVGFGLGLERLLIELAKNHYQPPVTVPQVYIVNIGDDAKHQALVLEQNLLDAGIAAVCELTRKNLADQLARAGKLNAHYALIIGKKELIDNTVILKDMASGNQEVLPQTKVVAEISRRYNAA